MSRRGENIYKRKDGRWEGRYIRGRTPAGKAEYGYVYAKSYAACREKRRKMEGVIPQKPTLTGEMSVAQAVAFFLSDRRGELFLPIFKGQRDRSFGAVWCYDDQHLHHGFVELHFHLVQPLPFSWQ